MIDAAVYCRWLRFIITELFCLSHNREDIDAVWCSSGVAFKLGMFEVILYEDLDLDRRFKTLKVLGIVIKELPTILTGHKLELISSFEVALKPKKETAIN